jgi:hypothetical protein
VSRPSKKTGSYEMQRISKRLEALERAAEKEVFANALPFAIAYYLGGAKHESEVVDAYARALGYQDLEGLCQGFADLLCQPSDSVDERSGIRMRIYRAQRKLLTKFGYDLRGASPAALADAAYRIGRTLPEELRATIKSGHREWCENEPRANRILEVLMQVTEGHQHGRRTRRRQGDPRQKKGTDHSEASNNLPQHRHHGDGRRSRKSDV